MLLHADIKIIDMFRFFRSIRKKLMREKRFSSYLPYAIGEIALVVIGIIIALQINIWNENRKEYKQIANYAEALTRDLEKDIEMIKVIEYTAKQISFRIDSLSNYIRDRRIEDISNLTLLSLTWVPVYRPYEWNRATLEELKSSGSLRLLKNRELANMIVEYDAFTRHMDEDYNTDKAQAEDALHLLSRVANNNYPNIEELNEVYRISTSSGSMDDIFSNPIYKEAEQQDLNLILNDLDVIHNALNSYIRLQYNLRIRTQIELPQLINDADSIIIQLRHEYKLSDSDGDHVMSQKDKDSLRYESKHH